MSVPMPSRLGFLLVTLLALASAACGPSRSTFARYPNPPAAFDRAKSNAQAVAIADKVLAAAGGAAAWDKARQIKWEQSKIENGAPKLHGEQALDRWNQRHYGRVETPDGAAIIAYAVYG